MFNNFPETDPQESFTDEMFNHADEWEAQLEFIGSLMDMPELPEDWALMVTEPDAEEMELINLNAAELLMDLQSQ